MKFIFPSKFILCIIILLLIITPITSKASSDKSMTSLFLSTSNGGTLSHYQITNNKVKKIWDTIFPLDDYDTVLIKDFYQNGHLEVATLIANRLLRMFDFTSGKLLWNVTFPSDMMNPVRMIAGDLTGDGNFEIIIDCLMNPFRDYGVMIYSALNGTLLTSIKSAPNQNLNGADDIAFLPVQNSNQQQLLVSRGNVLWNYTSNIGKYNLTLYRWNKLSKNMETVWTKAGIDSGGNAHMLVTKDDSGNYRIVTAGWYNNPVRAFDQNGKLLWQKQLEENKTLYMAQPHLKMIDYNGKKTLLVIQNNYWYNFTVGIFLLDLDSGNQIAKTIRFPDARLLDGYVANNNVFLATSRESQLNGSQISVNKLYAIYFNDNLRKEELKLPGGLFITSIYYGSPYYQSIRYMGNNYVLIKDSQNSLWLMNNEKQIKILENVPFVKCFTSITTSEELSGITVYNFHPWTIYIILLVSMIVLLVLIVNREILFTWIFNRSLKDNWQFRTVKRLQSIIFGNFEMKFQNIIAKEPKRLYNKIVETSKKSDTDRTSNIHPTITEILHDQTYPKDSPIWLEFSNIISKKIKIGDISILIELFDYYPSAISASEIVTKLNKRANTIYNRINKLIETKLITEIKEFGVTKADNRNKILVISEEGIELLLSMYYVLNSRFAI